MASVGDEIVVPDFDIATGSEIAGSFDSKIDASFAFAIMSELIIFPIIILSTMALIGKFPRHVLGPVLAISCPVLLIFSIITLSIWGDLPLKDAMVNDIKPFTVSSFLARYYYAVSTGIRAILISLFLLVVIILNKFAFSADLFLRPDEDVAAAKTSTYTPDQGLSQTSPYPTTPAIPLAQQPAPAYPSIQQTLAAAPVAPAQPPVPPQSQVP